MDTRPAIAVVVACHDLGCTVEEAVDSALAQSRPPAEVVVVDDGSTDVLTRQVLERLVRPRTRVVTIPHSGVATARNHGVGLTVAPYIALLDADDVLAPEYLERLASRLDARDSVGFVSCAVQAFEEASYTWTPPSTTFIGTLTRGSVHVSSLFRRALWDAVGGFDTALSAYEDLDFWLRAIEGGFTGAIVEEPLLHYRVRRDSRYRRGIEPAAYRAVMARILDRHRELVELHGIEVLLEKERFLAELTTYRDQLTSRRHAAEEECTRLESQIAERRSRAMLPRPSLEPATPGGSPSHTRLAIDRALRDRRWLIHGRVAVLADAGWLLDGVSLPRWDEGAAGAEEIRGCLADVPLDVAPLDCAVVVLVAPTEPLGARLDQVAGRLKPGGTLIVIAPAFPTGESAGSAEPPSETWLRSALSRMFPPLAFDVETREGVLVLGYARSGSGQVMPRIRYQRRTAPASTPSAGVILAYHRVAALSPDTYRLCLAPGSFREHLRYLREHCTVMPLVDLFLASRQDALPPRAVAITFDDGYLDALTTAAPLLVEEGLPATFFVNTERIDEAHEGWHDEVEHILLEGGALPEVLQISTPGGPLRLDLTTEDHRRRALMALHGALWTASLAERQGMLAELAARGGAMRTVRSERRLMTGDEIQALSRLPGCDIGSHSLHHLVLPRQPPAVQRAELAEAKATLEALLGRAVLAFAYPFGEHDESVARLVDAAPHLLAVTVRPGLVTSASDPMRLPRLEAPGIGAEGLADSLDRLFARVDPARAAVVPTIGTSAGADATPADAADRAWQENDARSREEYASGRVVLSARPQFLIMDPSSRCNARCVMCPVSFRAPGDHGTDLSRELFEKLAALVPTSSHVNLFSSGEPTLARGIVSMIQEVRRLTGPRTKVWLSTNGKRLTEEVAASLVAPGFGLQFSVDGGTRDVFESIRRGIRFDDLLESLELAQRLKGGRSYPALAFSSTMSKRNIHDLAGIFRLAGRFGVEHVYFYDEDPEVPEEEPFVLDEADRPIFEAQRPEIERTGVAYSNGLHFRGRDGLRAIEPEAPAHPPELRCLAPWKVLHVKADGEVRPCCTLRRSMGNLTHHTVEDVWNGPGYVALRRAFVEQSGIPGTCYRCTDPLRTWSEAPAEDGRGGPGRRRFSFDWLSEHIPAWTVLLSGFMGVPGLRFLEIGCFEGRATCWLLENVLTGDDCRITVIDTFEGGSDQRDRRIDCSATEATFLENTAAHRPRITVLKGASQILLRDLAGPFDFVYVDGSHEASDVLEDAVLAFRRLRPGGIMLFDDFEWDAYPDERRNPRLGISTFMRAYEGQYEVIRQGYQVAIQKAFTHPDGTVAQPSTPRTAR